VLQAEEEERIGREEKGLGGETGETFKE